MNSQAPRVFYTQSIDLEIQNTILHAISSANTVDAAQYQQNRALKHINLCLAEMAVWLMTNFRWAECLKRVKPDGAGDDGETATDIILSAEHPKTSHLIRATDRFGEKA